MAGDLGSGRLCLRPMGSLLAELVHMSSWCRLCDRVFPVVVLVRLVFSWIKRMVGEKLVSSDVFRGAEYYLGMLAGGVRSRVTPVAMAFLNARTISAEQIAADAKMQHDNFGDISFPTLGARSKLCLLGQPRASSFNDICARVDHRVSLDKSRGTRRYDRPPTRTGAGRDYGRAEIGRRPVQRSWLAIFFGNARTGPRRQ